MLSLDANNKSLWFFKPFRILNILILFSLSLNSVFGLSERDVTSVDNLPVCGLCDSNKTSVSCSPQVSLSLKSDECMMHRLNHSSLSCSDESFLGDIDQQNVWSDFSLSSYLYRHKGFHRIPNFNVTFSKIKWVYMKMRFKEVDTSRVAICEEFRINPDLVNTLFFDCLWDRGSYQNKPFTFEYIIKTPSGNKYLYKYMFHVPNSDNMWKNESNGGTNINELKVFSMVDLSNQNNGLPLIVEALPPALNVTVYKIKMTYMTPDKSSSETSEMKFINDQLEPSFTVPFLEHKKLNPGSYNFSITFEHPQCGLSCSISTTPVVNFKDTDRSDAIEMIVGALVLSSACFIIYFLIKRRMKKSCSVPGVDKPKVLLIYNPVSVDHVNTMKNLFKFFENYPLDVMIDILNIPLSEHQSPETWYIKAFKETNFVLIFTSPKSDCQELEKITRALIFSNTYSIAQAHLQLAASSVHAKCKFFSVSLPDTCWQTLPDVAIHFKRFALPQDIKHLLKALGIKSFCAKNKLRKSLENKLAHDSDETTITIDCNAIKSKEIYPSIDESQECYESPPRRRNQCYQCKQPEVYQLEPLCPSASNSPQSSRSSSPDCFI